MCPNTANKSINCILSYAQRRYAYDIIENAQAIASRPKVCHDPYMYVFKNRIGANNTLSVFRKCFERALIFA